MKFTLSSRWKATQQSSRDLPLIVDAEVGWDCSVEAGTDKMAESHWLPPIISSMSSKFGIGAAFGTANITMTMALISAIIYCSKALTVGNSAIREVWYGKKLLNIEVSGC